MVRGRLGSAKRVSIAPPEGGAPAGARDSPVGEEAVEAFLAGYYDAGSVRARADRDAFDLSRLYVAPDRWGEGVGRRLLAAAERAIAGAAGSASGPA